MKKIIVILLVVGMFSSCEKDLDAPECSCGTVVEDGINSNTNCYWLDVRNACTDNKKRFCVDSNTWIDHLLGDTYCSNSSW